MERRFFPQSNCRPVERGTGNNRRGLGCGVDKTMTPPMRKLIKKIRTKKRRAHKDPTI